MQAGRARMFWPAKCNRKPTESFCTIASRPAARVKRRDADALDAQAVTLSVRFDG